MLSKELGQNPETVLKDWANQTKFSKSAKNKFYFVFHQFDLKNLDVFAELRLEYDKVGSKFQKNQTQINFNDIKIQLCAKRQNVSNLLYFFNYQK